MEENKLSIVSSLFSYTTWAFDRVWECVEPLTDEQFCQEDGYSHGSVRTQFVHVMSVTDRWMQRLQEKPAPPHLSPSEFPTIEFTRQKWGRFINSFGDYIHTLDEENLDRTIHWQITSRNLSAENKRWELLLHLFNHATDHRAQILATLHYTFHLPTVEQDLIFYLTSTQSSPA